MIEKLSYVSVSGPKDELDRILDEYLSKYEIHLENSPLELAANEGVTPCADSNPYRELLSKADSLISLLKTDKSGKSAGKQNSPAKDMSREDAVNLVNSLFDSLADFKQQKADLEARASNLQKLMETLAPFKSIDFNLGKAFAEPQSIFYRYGRVPKEAIGALGRYSEENDDSLFVKCSEDENYIWGIYFVTEADASKVDAIYSSLKFERTDLSEVCAKSPGESYKKAESEFKEAEKALNDIIDAQRSLLAESSEKLISAKEKIANLAVIMDAKRLAVCTKEIESTSGTAESYYIIRGWLSEEDAKKLSKQLDSDGGKSFCIVNNNPEETGIMPPAKLKNRFIAKPFSMFTEMYGVPAYKDIDPTVLLCITYSFLFGAMFGDVGHGLFLIVIGCILYFTKKLRLGGIIATAGFFSTIFGFLFGSLFGFEDIIPAIWLKPREAMMNLSFIGRINTVFVVAILLGAGVLLLATLVNIYRGVKAGQAADVIFSSNGIAGFIFYAMLIVTAVLYMGGFKMPAGIILIVLICVPALCVALNEPLSNLLKKRKALSEGVGVFIVEAFFELFETCLSIFSNTLSFVRVGAFAISHAAMMEVVMSLTGYENGGNGSVIGLIFGNLFVIGFEGMIVGIQVLRLEYYEIFSKFYNGSGREFKPFFKNGGIN